MKEEGVERRKRTREKYVNRLQTSYKVAESDMDGILELLLESTGHIVCHAWDSVMITKRGFKDILNFWYFYDKENSINSENSPVSYMTKVDWWCLVIKLGILETFHFAELHDIFHDDYDALWRLCWHLLKVAQQFWPLKLSNSNSQNNRSDECVWQIKTDK